jgi:ribosomal protein S12 methylthiotransferase
LNRIKVKRNTIDLITLGCSKNLVDSEHLLRQLQLNGYQVNHDPEVPQGDIAVINTCGFIGDAKEESINTILQYCEAKSEGKVRKVYVMGCLSERYLKDLQQEIPQVDKFYGKFNWSNLLADLGKVYQTEHAEERILTTPSHYAYLKISEGCDRHCAYCAIPIITGHHVSRPMEEIISEVKTLVAKGVKEFQIIAQELTYYGVDLYHKQMLPELVEKISEVPGVKWIRLHYGYPANFPFDLLRVMRERPNVCNYLDIALQHISNPVLERMQRHVTKEETYQLVERLRKEVPGICLRTTLIVGFPGETEDDFEQLLEFVRWAKFERMGAFAYSEEEGTYAAEHYEDNVPQDVKLHRLDVLMSLQQEISAACAASNIGRILPVIIDRIEGEYYIGRTEFDSPEVDPEVLIPVSEGKLNFGEFYNVHISSADDFDLYGSVSKNQ